DRNHWLTDGQFLNAVALGQITPGPVTHTVTAVGYAAAGVGGGLLAAAIAFSPSFLFVLGGGRHFGELRENDTARAFLDGAGPAPARSPRCSNAGSPSSSRSFSRSSPALPLSNAARWRSLGGYSSSSPAATSARPECRATSGGQPHAAASAATMPNASGKI